MPMNKHANFTTFFVSNAASLKKLITIIFAGATAPVNIPVQIFYIIAIFSNIVTRFTRTSLKHATLVMHLGAHHKIAALRLVRIDFRVCAQIFDGIAQVTITID